MSSPDPLATGQARGQMEARIIDLSKGGARLHLPAPLDVGSLHSFSLRLGGESVLVHGRVKRCGPGGDDGAYEVAVEFVGMAPQDADRLGRYLDR